MLFSMGSLLARKILVKFPMFMNFVLWNSRLCGWDESFPWLGLVVFWKGCADETAGCDGFPYAKAYSTAFCA